MNILSLIPTTWILPAAGIALAATATWGGVQTFRLSLAEADTAKAEKQMADHQIAYDKAALKSEEDERAKSDQRQKDKDEIVANAQKVIEQTKAELVLAQSTTKRVSDYADRLAASARQSGNHPSASPGSAPTSDPAGVLANLLKRADKRAELVANYADAARDAGIACEQSYDSLVAGPAASAPAP